MGAGGGGVVWCTRVLVGTPLIKKMFVFGYDATVFLLEKVVQLIYVC